MHKNQNNTDSISEVKSLCRNLSRLFITTKSFVAISGKKIPKYFEESTTLFSTKTSGPEVIIYHMSVKPTGSMSLSTNENKLLPVIIQRLITNFK